MPLDIGGIIIEFDAGESYESDEPKARADARQEAIKQFREGAATASRGQIHKSVDILIALCVQLRAVGGVGTPDLANKLREAADFLEDL